jgi:very-short-patch-repair endonuclease
MRGPDSHVVPRARTLRRNQTHAEAKLWEQLRNRRLDRHKFLRQAPVGPFIVDFLCRERRLVIEVDGATHLTVQELKRDARRTAFLARKGFSVMRFTNEEIVSGMDQVLTVIRQRLNKRG